MPARNFYWSPEDVSETLTGSSNNNNNISSSNCITNTYDPISKPAGEINTNFINLIDVKNLLQKLDVCKSAGSVNISAKLLTKCASCITLPLSLLFMASLSSGIVPKVRYLKFGIYYHCVQKELKV